MAVNSEKTHIRVFISFENKSLDAVTWLNLAREILNKSFEVDDFLVHPVADADLLVTLRAKIAQSDVFIGLLTPTYLAPGSTTRQELDAAIAASTGSSSGSLKTQLRRPLVYLITFGKSAEDWCQTNHPGFTYFPVAKYGFNTMSMPPVPWDAAVWDDWFRSMEDRLKRPTAMRVMSALDAAAVRPSQLVIVGRPSGGFDATVVAARDRLLTDLGGAAEVSVINDGWYDRRDVDAAAAARLIVQGGSRSLIIQVCDRLLSADNRIEGDPLGADLRAKLQQIGLTRKEADIAVARTWFWVPSIDQADRSAAECEDDLPPFSEECISSGAAIMATAHAERITELVRLRLNSNVVRLEAEGGIDDLSNRLNGVMREYLEPMLFELVDPNKLAAAVKQAVMERAPILVLIHDRAVNPMGQPAYQVQARARAFDVKIKEITGGVTGLRIVRAILLIRHANKFFGEQLNAEESWFLLPLNNDTDPALPVDRMEKIKVALGLAS